MSKLKDFEAEVTRLRNRMSLIFDDLYSEADQPEPPGEVEWMPALDVLEDRDDIIVKVDIPGTAPDEIELSISGDVLHINGERKREISREDENYHTVERGYGRFGRRIVLPAPVNAENTRASYKDGVLAIRMPKLEKKKAEEIKVRLE